MVQRMMRTKVEVLVMCDFFLYTRSFTDPSSRRTRSVQEWDLLVLLFFVGELDVASGINGINVVHWVPYLILDQMDKRGALDQEDTNVHRDAGSYQLSHTWDQVMSRSRAPSSCKQSRRDQDVRRTSKLCH